MADANSHPSVPSAPSRGFVVGPSFKIDMYSHVAILSLVPAKMRAVSNGWSFDTSDSASTGIRAVARRLIAQLREEVTTLSLAAPTPTVHPGLLKLGEQRAGSVQNRAADGITWFAGSMWFVYLHIVVFGYWLLSAGQPFVDDPFPFGLLTMIVSLEAIFLSTFVMISQNRADARRQVLANHQWQLVQEEDQQNAELLALSRQLLELTQQLHVLTSEVHQAVKATKNTG